MPTSGIYRITIDRSSEGKSPKSYIGQSVNIERRWREHKSHCFNKKERSYNLPLYNSIRKYGLENTKHEVLFYCHEKDLNTLEEIWIEGLRTSWPNGYNMDSGGNAPGSISEETRRKQSEKMLELWKDPSYRKMQSESHIGINSGKNHWFFGKHHSKKDIEKMRESAKKAPVQALDKKTGFIIKEFESQKAAGRWLGKARASSAISMCCKGKVKSAYGYMWRYK